VVGAASLSHGIGRTWSSNLSYNRGLNFSPAFFDAVLSDNIGATLTGQLSRRISSNSGLSWTHGQVGFGDNRTSYTAAVASTGLQFAINHRVGAFIQYSFTDSETPVGITTLALAGTFHHHTAVAGLSLFAPLYTSERTRR